MVIVDTSVIIDHLRQKAGRPTTLKQLKNEYGKGALSLSLVTIQELYQGLSTAQAKKEKALLAVISPLSILPYTYEIAQQAGELTRDASRTLTFADATIAATALTHGIPLATLNVKDFAAVATLELVSLKDL